MAATIQVAQTRLTRRFAYAVAAVQAGAGLTGLILGPERFAGVTYKPAREWVDLFHLPFAPSTAWSLLLVILAAAAIGVLRSGSNLHARYAFGALAAYWVWWTVLYVCAWANPAAGPWAPWLAAMCVVGNARPVFARTLAMD